ncbi:MAG: glycosyltransferase family 4 protein [Bacteroidales bacterium]|nr:glycosyltransferase family 4 protein [Bacteroidales bacterium]
MRILIITNKFPYPPKDGGVIAKLAIITGLYQSNCQITVASMNTLKHYTDPDTLPQNIKKMADFRAHKTNTNISILTALKNLIFSKLPYNAERFINKDFSNFLIKILKEKEFDIIQLEGLYLCPYIQTVKKITNTPVSYRAHNIEHEIWDRTVENTDNPIKKWYLKILAERLKKFEKNFINKYDFLVPISHRDASILNSYGNTKPFHVCQTGIEISKTTLAPALDNTPTLFHLGGLDWTPNQQGLIWFLDNCWETIIALMPELIFRIAGRNAPDWFINKITQFKNVEFCDEIADASQFFADNTIMVVPLLAGSGMRIKIIEGMAYKKAIISTSIGAEGIDAIHKKEIFIANSATEFIEGVNYLLKNPDEISIIAENAYNFVSEKFNNTILTKDLLKFYESNIPNA